MNILPSNDLWSLCIPLGWNETEQWQVQASCYGMPFFESLLVWSYSIQLLQPSEHRNGCNSCMTVGTKACRRPFPTIFKPVQLFEQTLAMIPAHDQRAGFNDFKYNPWRLMNVPLVISDTMHTGCTLYMMGVYIVSTVDLPTEIDQRNIWMLLSKLFVFHTRHELHPKKLLVVLYLGLFLNVEQPQRWEDCRFQVS